MMIIGLGVVHPPVTIPLIPSTGDHAPPTVTIPLHAVVYTITINLRPFCPRRANKFHTVVLSAQRKEHIFLLQYTSISIAVRIR